MLSVLGGRAGESKGDWKLSMKEWRMRIETDYDVGLLRLVGEELKGIELDSVVSSFVYDVDEGFVGIDGMYHNVCVRPEVWDYRDTESVVCSGDRVMDDEVKECFVLDVMFLDGYDREEFQRYYVTEFEDLGNGKYLGLLDMGDGSVAEFEVKVHSSRRGSLYYS